MTVNPDELRSAVDALVEATVRKVIETAGRDAFGAVERAHLDRDRPPDGSSDEERWRRGAVFSTLLLGPLVDESEGEHPTDEQRDGRVRQLVDEGAVELARLVGEHPGAVFSIYEELYGEGASGDSTRHDPRDVAISLVASFDAEG
jgi:hypothetical protein